MPVFAGRHSAHLDGDFVVFLIGMRLNRPWRVRHLPWFMKTMPSMVRELTADPDSGFLGAQPAIMFGGLALVQYWRSFDHLERYARDTDALHVPAWREFNRRIRDSGDIGIWHETYRVRAGEYEAIYGNMPRVGLAKVGGHAPLGSTSTAAQRAGVRADDRAPVAGY
jgi:hypothetical protein